MVTTSVSEIFKTAGQPTVTYVKRDNGKLEASLRAGLEAKGQVCMLTGPSKAGKTTLYKKVLEEMECMPLIVRCDKSVTVDDFWRKALEDINFEQIVSIRKSENSKIFANLKMGIEGRWEWLAKIIGEANIGVDSNMGEDEIRQKIISNPSPKHLVKALGHLPVILVIEDFHYLSSEVQETVFQQWKTFVDSEISVLVVATTHHAVELARVNKDLGGRIVQIESGQWPEKDLRCIVEKGFKHLGIELPVKVASAIAKESVGMPIIAQQSALRLFIDKELHHVKAGAEIGFDVEDTYVALHNVAVHYYASHMNQMYERLVSGPKKKARKYDTYQLILLALSRDPLTFSLKREEIDERIEKMGISSEEKPPSASINSTLNALSRFQQRNKFELLEWSSKDDKLYVVEPTFLFFIRWREERKRPVPFEELMQTLLRKRLNMRLRFMQPLLDLGSDDKE